MSAPLTLEQQIAALVRQHGLAALCISAMVGKDGSVYFRASAQAEVAGVRICEFDECNGYSKPAQIADCFASAIDTLNAKRTVKADVPALAPMADVA